MGLSIAKPIKQQTTMYRIFGWLTSKNSLITFLMDGNVVTNAKMLCTVHVILTCYFLLRSLAVGYAIIGLCFIWMILALILWWKVK